MQSPAHRASLIASQMASLTLVFMSCVEGMVAQSLRVAATEKRWPLGSRSDQSTACLSKLKFLMIGTLLTEDDCPGMLRRVCGAYRKGCCWKRGRVYSGNDRCS